MDLSLIKGLTQQCGGEIHVGEESGWFSAIDNDMDGFYDNKQNCTWLIVADNHPTIRLQVLHIDIECGYDYLQVSDHLRNLNTYILT